MAAFGWVSFTTDYGTVDGFVAVCKGVVAGIAPDVTVIDVTHQVPPQDVRRGAAVLAQAVPWLPPAVHLAVVDPGVGTDRLGVALVTRRGVLVGPDNGLLPAAADALGGVTAAYALTDPAFQLDEVSATFHGRDVFAPVAAHLCRGLDPARLGAALDPAGLVRLPAPAVAVAPGTLRAEVVTIDTFGNVQLGAAPGDLAAAGFRRGDEVTVAGRPARVGVTFADVEAGELVVHPDSDGHVAVAVNGGSAAAELAARDGHELTVRAVPPGGRRGGTR